MTRLVLVRHGRTVWHAENRYAGRTDVELDDVGHAQAKALGQWARTAELTAIHCSPLTRALLTARACTAVTGLTERTDERLRELDFGSAEGLTAAEMRERDPAAAAAFERAPATDHFPGGEDPAGLVHRFRAALDDLADAYPGGRVLVVAHTTAIRLVLCAALGIPLDRYRELFPFVRNCGITEVGLDGPRFAVHQFNTPIEA